MTPRAIGAIGVKLIGVYFAVSGAIRMFATIASLGIPIASVDGLPNRGMILRWNFVAVLVELVMAGTCIVAGDFVAARIFSGRRRIESTHLSREDLLIVGIGLVGVSTLAAAAPNIIEVAGRAIWLAQGSLQSQFLPSMERAWDPLARNILEVVVGLVLVLKAGPIASAMGHVRGQQTSIREANHNMRGGRITPEFPKRMTMRCYSLALVCSVALLAWACSTNGSSSSTASPTTTAPTVTSVAVAGSAPAVGASAQFTATANFSNAATQTLTTQATWQSSAASVATVTSAGVVTGVSAGTADITATYQGVSAVAHITVAAATPSTFTVNGTVTNAATGAPIGNVSVSLVSDAGTKAAKTDSNGNYAVAGVAPGLVQVTASLAGYVTNSRIVIVSVDLRVDIALTPQ